MRFIQLAGRTFFVSLKEKCQKKMFSVNVFYPREKQRMFIISSDIAVEIYFSLHINTRFNEVEALVRNTRLNM